MSGVVAWLPQRRAGLFFLLVVALGLAGVPIAQAQGGAPGAPAAEASAPQKAAAPDPYGRDSPRGLALGLLSAFAANDYARAAQYLEPYADQPTDRDDFGAELAKRLKQRLDAGGSLLSFARLSKDPAGAVDDGLPIDQERLGAFNMFSREVPLIARRLSPAGTAPHWVVSEQSLNVVTEQPLPTTAPPALTDALPEVLSEAQVGGAPLADWLVLAALAAGVFFGMRLLFMLLLKLMHALLRDPETNRAYKFAYAAFPPLSLYLSVLAFFAATNQLQLAIVARQTLVRYAGIVGWVALVWFLWRLIDLGADLWAARMARSDRRRAMSALTFGRRSAKTVLALVALGAILDTLGVDVTTGVAALGIGGLALALGAQKTIENLVGSVTVIADQPVRVGDFCKVGSVLGTVEDIGMRSTRIRTNERTVVTIPNGAFSSQQIENYSRRDRFLFAPTIGLTYDTDAALMRKVLDGIRNVLEEDGNVADNPRVRFVSFNAHSLDIEIFAYIQTFDYGLSLGMREQVLLKIMDKIAELGASIAFPTQTVLVKSS